MSRKIDFMGALFQKMPGRAVISRYVIVFSCAVTVLGLDQASKWLALAHIPEYGSINIIPGFFDLVNIRNRGAAFGFLNRSDIEWQFWLFLLATIVAIWAILLILRQAKEQKLLFCGLGLILGGAIGNLLDRLRFRAVTDFLDFYWGQWHWPAFNVADMGICIGAFLACLSIWLEKPDGGKA